MLGVFEAIATLAVRDIVRAREFYEGKLGLEPERSDEQSRVVSYKTGKSHLLVYESDFAGTNQATAVNFAVGDQVDYLAKEMAKKGVVFERYDMGGAMHEGDVHVWGDFRTVWFKDPDGNILSLVSGHASDED